MIVKSVLAGTHYEYLSEAFTLLQKHNMRFNLEKCSCGIQGGKLLVFVITMRGIEVNPGKCKAILEMHSPTLVKEV